MVQLSPYLVVVAAIVLFGVALVIGPVADMRHPVVTVNGQVIDRTELRARLVLERSLAEARAAIRRSLVSTGRMTAAEAERAAVDDEQIAADPLRFAIDGLVRDELIRAAATERGLSTDANIDRELRDAATRDVVVRVRVVTFGLPLTPRDGTTSDWPGPPAQTAPPAEVARAEAAAGDRLRQFLESWMSEREAVEALAAAGWRASGSERWLAESGPVEGIAPTTLATVRASSLAPGSAVGPVADRLTGLTTVAMVVSRERPDGAIAPELIRAAGVDPEVLRRWAAARAMERTLRTDLAAGWATQPMELVRATEVVVGPADLQGPAGPYVSFAHLVVKQLPATDRPAGSDDAAAAAIADALRGLDPVARWRRFQELIAAANRAPSSDPLTSSGELGYFTADQLIPELATSAFDPRTKTGDLLGPITTTAGPEVFIVRGRFGGVLDERASAALVEIRSSPDLAALARRISPIGQAGRADGTLWRSLDEVSGVPAAHAAYRDTAIGTLSEPFVIDGQIVVVRPEGRAQALADPDTVARLLASGFDQWLAAQRSSVRSSSSVIPPVAAPAVLGPSSAGRIRPLGFGPTFP